MHEELCLSTALFWEFQEACYKQGKKGQTRAFRIATQQTVVVFITICAHIYLAKAKISAKTVGVSGSDRVITA